MSSDLGSLPAKPESARLRPGRVLRVLSLGVLALLSVANAYTLWLARTDCPGNPVLPEAVAHYYGCQPGAAIAGAPLMGETIVLVGAMACLVALRARPWAGYAGVVTVIALGAAFFRAPQF